MGLRLHTIIPTHMCILATVLLLSTHLRLQIHLHLLLTHTYAILRNHKLSTTPTPHLYHPPRPPFPIPILNHLTILDLHQLILLLLLLDHPPQAPILALQTSPGLHRLTLLPSFIPTPTKFLQGPMVTLSLPFYTMLVFSMDHLITITNNPRRIHILTTGPKPIRVPIASLVPTSRRA